jgi:hypothetical protein
MPRIVNRKRLIPAVIFAVLFFGAMTGAYLYFSKKIFMQPSKNNMPLPVDEDITALRIYYPVKGRLEIEERRTQRRLSLLSLAEAVAGEYFKGPAGLKDSFMPGDVKVLGVFFGIDGILYVNLSDEFRSGFRGDAIEEFLLLRGLYDSLMSNIGNISDVKVLIEGKEIETIGGHMSLLYPLGKTTPKTSEEEGVPVEGQQ